ncbi:MAG: hypothetical protein K9G70_09755 [Prolixibacteraceae bacterium]|nr:hypothetical protein [Prolixibacteraceae bacterium]
MKNSFLRVITAILAWVALSGWGYTGHRAITLGASESFLPKMEAFQPWVEIIANHSSDADNRKGWDKTEGKKHYIDVDNYKNFLTSGHISMIYNVLVDRYGLDFVHKQGTLPWATLASYDTLVACFERNDFDKAVLAAADLSHYVADGHMPLHITKNYNGQLTGNEGIHSRYESAMISMFVDEINFKQSNIIKLQSPDKYVFSYLYESYNYVDSVLIADDYAFSVADDKTSFDYQIALWNETNHFSKSIFQDAAIAFARLFYTAWLEAGSPNVSRHSFSDEVARTPFALKYVSVDYDNISLKVLYLCEEAMTASFTLYDEDKNKVLQKDYNIEKGGVHEKLISLDELIPGKYELVFSGNDMSDERYFVIRD